jgi:hypothetical protein
VSCYLVETLSRIATDVRRYPRRSRSARLRSWKRAILGFLTPPGRPFGANAAALRHLREQRIQIAMRSACRYTMGGSHVPQYSVDNLFLIGGLQLAKLKRRGAMGQLRD